MTEKFRCLIVDDESAAHYVLTSYIERIERLELAGQCYNVLEAINFLHQNPVDLLFLDINMPELSGFDLLKTLTNPPKVIITTAYSEFALESYEYWVIDYLLKPIKQEKLEAALKKYTKLKQHFSADIQQLLQTKQQIAGDYKKRFLVKRGTDYISIKSEDIAYFYATHKLVCMIDNKNQKFILDQSLSDIEKQLDPSQFYRVNRKYLVHLNAIKKIKCFPKSKLQLELEPAINDDIIISQDNVTAFKEWMAQ